MRRAVPWWGMPGTRLPMFPLSAVLFPHASMPLHVFEPRYRDLMRDCLAGDARFGIVLIERGSEVGGGDERSALGTRGVISRAAELPDGRWVLEITGEALIVVEEWLPDDPYPVALVRDAAAAPAPGDAGPLVGAAAPTGPPGPGPAGGAGWRATARARPGPRRGRGRRSGLLAALRGSPAERLRRAAPAGGGRRGGASAPAGRVDGRARARSAAHAAGPVRSAAHAAGPVNGVVHA